MHTLNSHVALTALSPLDGRYHSQLTDLANLFSEFALIKQRVRVEVEYLLFLSKHGCVPSFSEMDQNRLREIVSHFSVEDAQAVKDIEKKTKHDVKAVEYFLRQRMIELELPGTAFLHLALTSEDVNSIAYSLMIQESKTEIMLPKLNDVLRQLTTLIEKTAKTPMLARTHGQEAVPTTVGKELAVFAMRLLPELEAMTQYTVEAKLTGAVGNFNAHIVAFPEKDWLLLSEEFVESLGLTPTLFTTQILATESYSELFSRLVRVNGVLLDLNQDIWRYISDHYFGQHIEEGQVGSSTMPQKINPIDFENSEGNIGLANSLFTFFIQKLPISRLQRDLSDSTVKRSIGSAFGYSALAYTSLSKGLQKLSVNEIKMREDLERHWEVLAEAVQVVLRKEGDDDGYEKLKTFSQGKKLGREELAGFINALQISEEAKRELQLLTPENYIGLSPLIAQRAVQRINQYLEGAS